jgi:cytochrome c oxidase assembly protein subunit 15
VGVLITVLMIASWVLHRRRRRSGLADVSSRAALSPWWATATFLWVCLQGAFGAWTVTMKLYPAIVTAHLLGGLGLLALLAAQSQSAERRPLALSRGLFVLVGVVAALSVVQVSLGGWVSTK